MDSKSLRFSTSTVSSSSVGFSRVAFRAEIFSASSICLAMSWFSSLYASVAWPPLPMANVYTTAAFRVPSTALNRAVRNAENWSLLRSS